MSSYCRLHWCVPSTESAHVVLLYWKLSKFWCAVKRNNLMTEQNSSWWLVGHKWMIQNSLRGIFKYLVYLLCIMRRNMCKQYCIFYTFSSFFCLWDHWGILNMHFYFWTQSEFLSLMLGWSFWCVWWYIFVCCVSIRITTNRRIDFEKNDISEIFSLALTPKFYFTSISWVLNLWNGRLVNQWFRVFVEALNETYSMNLSNIGQPMNLCLYFCVFSVHFLCK